MIAFASSAPRKKVESASKKYVEQLKFEFAANHAKDQENDQEEKRQKPKKQEKQENQEKPQKPHGGC